MKYPGLFIIGLFGLFQSLVEADVVDASPEIVLSEDVTNAIQVLAEAGIDVEIHDTDSLKWGRKQTAVEKLLEVKVLTHIAGVDPDALTGKQRKMHLRKLYTRRCFSTQAHSIHTALAIQTRRRISWRTLSNSLSIRQTRTLTTMLYRRISFREWSKLTMAPKSTTHQDGRNQVCSGITYAVTNLV